MEIFILVVASVAIPCRIWHDLCLYTTLVRAKALFLRRVPSFSYTPGAMKSLLAISILLFAAPFLLYFCDGCGSDNGPFDLELEDFGIYCLVHDKDGLVGPGPDGYRVEKTDAFNIWILLEDSRPWTLAFLRKSGGSMGFQQRWLAPLHHHFGLKLIPLRVWIFLWSIH